ncbi:hypothetical protein KR018_004153 [Drosophila ironensis]|nr:hypothetical protein KR018_004153 [Drosophila ironensis]
MDMHRHHGIFLARNRNDAVLLLTQTTTTEDDYGEKRLTTEFGGKSCVFRSWSPFRSKLAAGVMTGLRDLHLQQGSKVLYLGAGFGRTITHLSDIVGESGKVYAVEHGPWTDRELEAIAARRPNIHPVIENATLPYKYRNLVPASIDVICCDLPQADQVHSLKLNARHYLVPGGHFLTFMRTPIAEGAKTDIVALECGRLRQEHLEPQEQISLVPFMPGFTLVAGVYTRRNGVA